MGSENVHMQLMKEKQDLTHLSWSVNRKFWGLGVCPKFCVNTAGQCKIEPK